MYMGIKGLWNEILVSEMLLLVTEKKLPEEVGAC